MDETKRKRVKYAVVFLVIGALVNFGLAFVKLYIGLRSQSVTVMLDATNNFFDILSCLVTIAAFAVLLREKRRDSVYGYGRAEYIAGFAISVIVLVTGAVFLYESVTRLAMPTPIWFSWSFFVIMAVAVVLKLGLGFYYFFINRKIKSKAFSALTLDSFLDTAVTATALISFTVSGMVDFAVDAIFGIILSIVIIIFGLKSASGNIGLLLGRGADEELEGEIRRTALSFSQVKSVGEVTVHDYGYKKNIGTAELTLERDMKLSEAEEIAGAIGEAVYKNTEARISVVLKYTENEDSAETSERPESSENPKVRGYE